MKRIVLQLIFLLVFLHSIGQNSLHTNRVLFIGNSYTYVNNLPQMVADVALSMGDTVLFDSNTIGGYTLQMHSVDATTLSKIMQGNWDYVVLQEQSQLPSFTITEVDTEVFPYARFLDSMINLYNPCAETMFYMTWGRKNGDASNCAVWPPVCTYQGMDSLLYLRYMMMADSNHAEVSPVGAVRHFIRDNSPSIELYQSDESHPTVEGTYAAACTFYTSIFRKNPELISFNSTLIQANADSIKHAAKVIGFDSLLKWNIGLYDQIAAFTYLSNGLRVDFTNSSSSYVSCKWYFGDGDSSILNNPIHIYQQSGTYLVTLIASTCGKSDTTYQTITVAISSIINIIEKQSQILVFPNPTKDELNIKVPNNSSDKTFIEIMDVYGSTLYKDSFNGTIYTIKIPFNKGVYFLSIIRDNEIVRFEKIILI